MTEQTNRVEAVNATHQMIEELKALSDAVKATVIITEKPIRKIGFPIRFNKITNKDEWNEQEIKDFCLNPENRGRIIFCQEVNIDVLDDWGMFGYTPGFIYVENKIYEGSKTLADQAASVGLSVGFDPSTGLGFMNSYDYFPKLKYEHRLIRMSEFPDVFKVMCEIFTKKNMGDAQKRNTPLLGRGK